MWLTLNVFPFIFIGYKMMKNSEPETWKDAIGCGMLCWGLMMGIFWCLMTFALLGHMLFSGELNKEHIQDILNRVELELNEKGVTWTTWWRAI
jgi:hypothetical protein